jgi:hypothetical protein
MPTLARSVSRTSARALNVGTDRAPKGRFRLRSPALKSRRPWPHGLRRRRGPRNCCSTAHLARLTREVSSNLLTALRRCDSTVRSLEHKHPRQSGDWSGPALPARPPHAPVGLGTVAPMRKPARLAAPRWRPSIQGRLRLADDLLDLPSAPGPARGRRRSPNASFAEPATVRAGRRPSDSQGVNRSRSMAAAPQAKGGLAARPRQHPDEPLPPNRR